MKIPNFLQRATHNFSIDHSIYFIVLHYRFNFIVFHSRAIIPMPEYTKFYFHHLHPKLRNCPFIYHVILWVRKFLPTVLYSIYYIIQAELYFIKYFFKVPNFLFKVAELSHFNWPFTVRKWHCCALIQLFQFSACQFLLKKM